MSGTPIQIWRPSLKAVGLRTLGIFLTTYVLFTPGWLIFGGIANFFLSMSTCLLYMFFQDDFTQWLAHRKTIWILTSNDLSYENAQEDTEKLALPLSEITSVHQRFLWNVQLRLRKGTAVTIFHLNNPKAVCETLRTTVVSKAAL
jgi:hypothetical protein